MIPKSVSGSSLSTMTYTRVQNVFKRGIGAAPLKRSEVGEIARAVKAYKIKDDITIYSRRQRRNTK
jgi:hypothetical protein